MSRDNRSQNPDKQKTNGFFRRAMPTMPMPLAVVCCLLNIIIPGFGTLLAAFSVFCCARHKCDTNLKAFFTNVLAFFLQLLSALVIFGWVWSIRYGLMFIHMSRNVPDDLMLESSMAIYARRHSSVLELSSRVTKVDTRGTSLLAKLNEETSSR